MRYTRFDGIIIHSPKQRIENVISNYDDAPAN